MISVTDLTLTFGERVLFKDVNQKFTPGNCYGVIGANGAGKSTFLKVLSGEQDYDKGEVFITPGERLAVLKQDHFQYDESLVIDTVLMGHQKLYQIMKEKEAIYMKEDFSQEDGVRAGELEQEFSELGGWEAESQAAVMLSGLGLEDELHQKYMKELNGAQKVRVLLAQALFGNPDILLLDEPTNHLDLESITWLEEFLIHFPNTVIVVSHDRHFLNQVCTHIIDIDYSKVKQFVGNYDFWYESSQIIQRQMKDERKKKEEKAAELKAFIQRFASNASKSKQATSRKKLLEKLNLEDLQATSRRFPYVAFKPERECGDVILEIKNLSKTIDGVKVLDNLNLSIHKDDKVAFVGTNHLAKTTLFQILNNELEPDEGEFRFGVTISSAYFPKDNSSYFNNEHTLVSWLRQYSPNEQEESYIRGFLGRMLFSGEESLKSVKVLSGGEKVRCMLSKMMLSGANFLIFDEPTNHLDLESITALNNGLAEFSGVILFNSHDHQFVNTVANRIIEFTPGGIIDRVITLDEYLANPQIQALRDKMYENHHHRLNI